MSYPVQGGAGGSWPTATPATWTLPTAAAPGAIWAAPTAADAEPRSGFDPETWRRPQFGPVVGGVCNIDARTGLASCRMAPTPFLGVLNY